MTERLPEGSEHVLDAYLAQAMHPISKHASDNTLAHTFIGSAHPLLISPCEASLSAVLGIDEVAVLLGSLA